MESGLPFIFCHFSEKFLTTRHNVDQLDDFYDNCFSDSIISSLESNERELSRYCFVLRVARRVIHQSNISAVSIVVGYNQVCQNIYIPKESGYITSINIRNMHSKMSLILKLFWDICSVWRKAERNHWLETTNTSLTEPWGQRQELLIATSLTSRNHEPKKGLLWFRNSSVRWRNEKNPCYSGITEPFVRKCNFIWAW